jgi:hypothetical protein
VKLGLYLTAASIALQAAASLKQGNVASAVSLGFACLVNVMAAVQWNSRRPD